MNKEKNICELVWSFCRKDLENCENILVGFSGGPDSVTLLHVLAKLRQRAFFKAEVLAAHVNHLLRGEESFRDESFVGRFCEKYDIELKVLRVSIEKESKLRKKSIEETARLFRYNFFEEIASKKRSTLIAVAHTLTDSIETTIFNLTRGTGIDGLCGIQEVQGKIIRPLINFTKKDTLDYCKVNNLPYVEDSSNNSLEYSRNKIRHKILPVLESICPNFHKTFSRMFSLLKEDANALNVFARKKLNECKISGGAYDISKLKFDLFSIKSRFIRMAFSDFAKEHASIDFFSLSYKAVNLILDHIKEGSGTLQISKEVFAEVTGNLLKFFRRKSVDFLPDEEKYCIPLKKLLTCGKKGFTIKLVSFPFFEENFSIGDRFKNFLDFDAVPENTVLRTRLPGDKFCPPFRSVNKSLRKFFNECKIPKEIRDGIPLLASGSRVLWVDGVSVCKDCCIDKGKTKKLLFIERRKS